MNYEKIVTLYDSAEHAGAAKRNLESAGFPPSEMSMVSNTTLAAAGQTLREPGLWHRLFGREIAQHEATVYGRTVEAGGVVLTVRVPESEAARAMGILNAHQVVDVQQRAIQQGLISATSVPKTTPAMPAQPIAQPIKTAAMAGTLGKDEVLRLAEEELSVGKRLIQEGTTRIRRFVTEKPVEAQITLHEEHVKVVRRAVADPASVQDIDWTDKTVEVTETMEEAVVNKSAHIAEEVVIRKEGSDHVETVRGTVRRQQVEIENLTTGNQTKMPPKTSTSKG
jgi:uncharacterized protein (TIGR02271 family)